MYGYLEDNFNLTSNEICGFMTILLGAGTSTKHTLTNLVVELLSIAPHERRLIFNEIDAHEFVERGLFSGGGVNYIYRTLDDKNIQCLNIAAANESAQHCPFSSDSNKSTPPSDKHIAFGFGAHKCIGEALSKNIMTKAIHIIVEQCPNARITSGKAPRIYTHSQQPQITVDV